MSGSDADPYRVMIVDDSAIVRGLVTRLLEEAQGIAVVASVANGQMALNALDRCDVEITVLDIEMPVMDGLTALPKLIEKDRDLQVVIASTLTQQNADISIKALSLGAADYIAKPTSRGELHSAQAFRRELVDKVKALGQARRAGGGAMRRMQGQTKSVPAPRPFHAEMTKPETAKPLSGPKSVRETPAERTKVKPAPKLQRCAMTLRPAGTGKPDLIAIGSSTGGPQALFEVMRAIKDKIDLPILITQHMPATFTTILAEHLQRIGGWPTAEGGDGEIIRRKRVYIAPGGYHMIVEKSGADRVIRLTQTPPENFCRPSVDPMLRSISETYGAKVLTAILTGMGHDGRDGASEIVAKGGTVIAQDEASSIVWGMPGAVAMAGVCSAVLPLAEIGPHIVKVVGGAA